MNYETFIQEISACVKNQLSETEKLEQHQVMKNNGILFHGISIRKNNAGIAPVIYLESFYERYQAGESIEQLSGEILKNCEDLPFPKELDDRVLLEFEGLKERIVYRLVNREKNEQLLKEIPHLPMFDLAIIFYVAVLTEGMEDYAMLIRNAHLKLWKVPISYLYEIARENTPRLYPDTLRPLGDYLHFVDECEPMDSPLWILTNVTGVCGASAILYPKMPKRIFDTIKNSYYLLPSSIHEFLVVPAEEGICEGYLQEMVRAVNKTEVAEEEVLSDSVYFFDGKNITKI